MSTIKLENLTKAFGDLIAVNNVSLKVDENEVLCLLGPSGCGKTTTLRMVAGLEVATSGDIFIGNKKYFDLSLHSGVLLLGHNHPIFLKTLFLINMQDPLMASTT